MYTIEMHKGHSHAVLLEITTPDLLRNHPASTLPATYKSNVQNSKINSNDKSSARQKGNTKSCVFLS